MQLPPRNKLVRSVGLIEEMTQTFLCPTKNPNPNVSVVKVILLPLGTAHTIESAQFKLYYEFPIIPFPWCRSHHSTSSLLDPM